MSLAREAGTLLVWDAAHRLTLLDRQGQARAEKASAVGLTAIASADDGSRYAAGSQAGHVWLLNGELRTRREVSVQGKPTAMALEAFGQRLAVADESGSLHFFDQRGRTCWKVHTPRPLRWLRFAVERPVLVGAADQGLVVCYDADGKCLWQDVLFAYIGGLGVSGDGRRIALACYSEGVRPYDEEGKKSALFAGVSPVKRLALSYDGQRLLAEDLQQALSLRTLTGSALWTARVEEPIVGLALGALGTEAYLLGGHAVTGTRLPGL
jgi:hypothetical protein